MGYQWEVGEPIPDGFRRIAEAELDAAISSLSAPEDRGIEAAVHDARKRCKKVRGLARVVRPGLGGAYRQLNDAVRDAAREISPIRDAHAILASFDHLLVHTDGELEPSGLFAVRAELSRRSRDATLAVSSHDTEVRSAISRLEELRGRAPEWTLDDDFEVVAVALTTTYRRGRSAMRRARHHPDDDILHQWRKREKDLWYAVRLLTPSAPAVLAPLAKALHVLSEDLGDDHDLAVLGGLLQDDPDAFGGPEAVEAALQLAAHTRAALQDHAFGLGCQLYAEKPDAFASRLSTHWKTWVDRGDALPDATSRS